MGEEEKLPGPQQLMVDTPVEKGFVGPKRPSGGAWGLLKGSGASAEVERDEIESMPEDVLSG